MEYSANLELSAISRVVNEQVLGRLDAIINAAGGAMQSAGSDLMRSKADAEVGPQGHTVMSSHKRVVTQACCPEEAQDST